MNNNTASLWTSLCSPTEPYTLDTLRDRLEMLTSPPLRQAFFVEHRDVEVMTMRDLSKHAGSPRATRAGKRRTIRTNAVQSWLCDSEMMIYHPQLTEVWAEWLHSPNYREDYEALSIDVDPIAPIAASDTVALVRLGSEIDREVCDRRTELPLVSHVNEEDWDGQLRMASLVDTMSLIAYVQAR